MDLGVAKLQYGHVVSVKTEGHALLFRGLSPNEARRINVAMLADPAAAIDLAEDLCQQCCLSGDDAYAAFTEQYPLAVSDGDILTELIRLAELRLDSTVKAAVREWKTGDRKPGIRAEHLLAFKAYQGGDYNAEEMAGALAIAEWMSATKGIFNLVMTLLKGLAKRSGR